MPYYVLNRSDGGVSIMFNKDAATLDSDVAKWELNTKMTAISVHPVNRADIPPKNGTRNQWVWRNGRIEVDPTRPAVIAANPR